MSAKLYDLTVLSTVPASGDLFYVIDVSDTTEGAQGTNKQVNFTTLTSTFATAGANSNITSLSGLTTPLSVAQGGTGAVTHTSGNVLLGAGTSTITSVGTTGSGNVVRVTSPTLVTPVLGVATATSINGLTLTTSTGVITITNAKTLTVSDSTTLAINSITFAGTEVLTLAATKSVTFADAFATSGANPITLTAAGSTNVTLPTSGTLTTNAGTVTLTNKRITKRTVTVTQSATPVINTDNTDVAYITGLAQAITSMTSSLSGTPVANDSLIVSITDDGTARAISWGASFESSGNIALPTTTVISTRLDVGFLWNVATSKWRCVAAA